MRTGRPSVSVERRFARMTQLPNEAGCMEWQGRLDRDGYGHIGVPGNRSRLAHRFSYELFVEPIPAGLQIDHLCRNRRCVNPLHLEVVTAAENALRGVGPPAVNAQRMFCIHGHLLSGGNVYRTRGRTSRVCRECTRARNARAYATRQAARKFDR